jgi:Na+-exporting ATPase
MLKSRYVLSRPLLADILVLGLLLGACSIAVFTSIVYGVDGGQFSHGNCTIAATNMTASCNCNSPANYDNCQNVFAARGATFLAMGNTTIKLGRALWSLRIDRCAPIIDSHLSLALIIMFSAFNCRDGYRPFWHNLRAVTRTMFIGTVIVFAVVFILIYVPGLNVYVMHHDALSWQLGLAFGALAVYMVLATVWKSACKSRLFPDPHKN